MSGSNYDQQNGPSSGPSADSTAVGSRVSSGDATANARPSSTDLIRPASGIPASLSSVLESASDRGEAVFAREPSTATLHAVRSKIIGRSQVWE